MLQNLYVKDLALIDEADVAFESGLNILSGETGAGKSIIIGSINLALGAKVPKDIVRKNAESAYVELVFQIEDTRTQKILEENGIRLEDNQLIIGRRISSSRSICKINGESVPASKIKEISHLLIDIHGQHEHQSLLYKSKHLEILDAFAKSRLNTIKQNVSKIYRRYISLRKELEEFKKDEEQRRREMSFLEFEVNEIESANLVANEEEKLDERHRLLSHGKQIVDGLNEIIYDMSGSLTGSAQEAIGKGVRTIQKLCEYDNNLSDIKSQLFDAEALISDITRDISSYVESIEVDEENLAEIAKRLELIHNLKKKYGSSVEEILQYADRKKIELEKLIHFDENKRRIEKEYKETVEELNRLCETLSNNRKEASLLLTKYMKQSLEDLNFLDVRFEMEFKRLDHFTSEGFDEVEFVISTNPGEDLKPLGAVASGGELSRIMLAIKTVLADSDEIDTLVFDEIDAGISGRTAQMVSEKLSVIGGKHQVICISHLPQIVAMADSHFLIAKNAVSDLTTTKIKKLNENDSVMELARLLGGSQITETTLASAKEMKELAIRAKLN